MSHSSTAFGIECCETPEGLQLTLSGVIDEEADLDFLAYAEAPVVRLDLAGVRRINSFGVRTWIDAVRNVPPATRLVFTRCSPSIIDQCNMVAGFMGHAIVESFYAPMICVDCGQQLQTLYDTEECMSLGGKLPATSCPHCQGVLEMDDFEVQYLMFLRAL